MSLRTPFKQSQIPTTTSHDGEHPANKILQPGEHSKHRTSHNGITLLTKVLYMQNTLESSLRFLYPLNFSILCIIFKTFWFPCFYLKWKWSNPPHILWDMHSYWLQKRLDPHPILKWLIFNHTLKRDFINDRLASLEMGTNGYLCPILMVIVSYSYVEL